MRKTDAYGACESGAIPVIALVCALLPWNAAGLQAEGWCDLVFQDVLDEASAVIVADYEQSRKSLPRITVREVLKGSCTDEDLDLDLREMAEYGLKDGDQLILALTSFHQPVRVVSGMGGCTPVSVLPIRGGKLRSRDRANYDFRSKSMSLQALKAELLDLLQPDS